MINNNTFHLNYNFNNYHLIPKETQEIVLDGLFDVKVVNRTIENLKKRKIEAKIICKVPLDSIGKEVLDEIQDKDMILFYSDKSEKRLSVDDMYKVEKTLDIFVEDIKKSNLSPYEKYVAVYYIVKSFKKYKEYAPHSLESRSIYLTLTNDYLVCVGYSTLLVELLKRVGIQAEEIGVFLSSPKGGHSRCMVNLVDSKYDIDGIFFCDPTKDEYQARNKDFFEIAPNMNMDRERAIEDIDYDPLLSFGLIFPKSDEELYKYLLSNTNVYEIKKLEKIDPNFITEVGKIDKYFPRDDITLQYAAKLNNYLQRKMSTHISREIQYKTIIEIKQFIEGRKYTPDEYEREWKKITSKDIVYKFDSIRSKIPNNNQKNNNFEFKINIDFNEYKNKRR